MKTCLVAVGLRTIKADSKKKKNGQVTYITRSVRCRRSGNASQHMRVRDLRVQRLNVRNTHTFIESSVVFPNYFDRGDTLVLPIFNHLSHFYRSYQAYQRGRSSFSPPYSDGEASKTRIPSSVLWGLRADSQSDDMCWYLKSLLLYPH